MKQETYNLISTISYALIIIGFLIAIGIKSEARRRRRRERRQGDIEEVHSRLNATLDTLDELETKVDKIQDALNGKIYLKNPDSDPVYSSIHEQLRVCKMENGVIEGLLRTKEKEIDRLYQSISEFESILTTANANLIDGGSKEKISIFIDSICTKMAELLPTEFNSDKN